MVIYASEIEVRREAWPLNVPSIHKDIHKDRP